MGPLTTRRKNPAVENIAIVAADRQPSVTVPLDVIVIAETVVTEPKMVAADAMSHAGVPVHPVQSIVRPSLGMSAVTTRPTGLKAFGIDTSSCGSGTREVHAVDVDHVALPALIVTVAAFALDSVKVCASAAAA